MRIVFSKTVLQPDEAPAEQEHEDRADVVDVLADVQRRALDLAGDLEHLTTLTIPEYRRLRLDSTMKILMSRPAR